MPFVTLGGSELLSLVFAIVLAFVLALPVGWECKSRSRSR